MLTCFALLNIAMADAGDCVLGQQVPSNMRVLAPNHSPFVILQATIQTSTWTP